MFFGPTVHTGTTPVCPGLGGLGGMHHTRGSTIGQLATVQPYLHQQPSAHISLATAERGPQTLNADKKEARMNVAHLGVRAARGRRGNPPSTEAVNTSPPPGTSTGDPIQRALWECSGIRGSKPALLPLWFVPPARTQSIHNNRRRCRL